MEYRCRAPSVKVEGWGFVVDVGSLCQCLGELHGHRKRRGVRYPLVLILVLVVLAKMAGEDRVSGIAEWVRLRARVLAKALHFARSSVPHRTTYSRILGHVVDVEELERVVSGFFGRRHPRGRSVVINVDGKTLRGTIPAGESEGIHLLAAYLPAEGWVLMQVEVGQGENEISAAPRLLEVLDLRGSVVTGDAMLAQRELSAQIVSGGGDYVWPIKENHGQTLRDIETLFEPERCVKGFSPGITDFHTAETVEKRHGRIDRRTITVSGALRDYLDWPGVEQVFKLERHSVRVKDGKVREQTAYGLTSLKPEKADAKRVLGLVRGHWQIENGLHYRRDETLREDWCHLRTGHASRTMAVINNLVLGLLNGQGLTNVPMARRYYAVHLKEAMRLVMRC